MLIEDEVDHRFAGLGWSLRVRRGSHRISGSAWWHAAAMVAAILAASATVSYTVAVVLQLHVVLPVWDEWAWVSDLRQIWDGAYDWSDLIHPHNEHRIFFPRLIMLADASLFRMGGWSVLVTTFLLQAANAGVLVRSMTQLVKGAVPRVLLGSLVILVLFSLRQRDNLDNVFQVQFVGVFTAAIVAITLYCEALARQAEGSRGATRPFIVAALSCTVATYTMANGVMTGFVLVVLAILVRAAWLTVLATLVAAVILAAAFFYHYSPLGTPPSLAYAVTHAGRCIAYFLAYLGNPISTKLFVAQVFGGLGVLAVSAAAWFVVTGRTSAPASVALLGVAGFIVASACTTVYGRASLGSAKLWKAVM